MRLAARLGVALLLSAWAIAGPRPAESDADTGRQIDGQSGPAGVTVHILAWDDHEQVQVSGAPGGGDGCDWSILPPPTGTWYTPPENLGPPPTPASRLGVLACNGVGQRLIWVNPGDVLDVGAEARRVVQEYLATVPVPRPTIRVSPPAGLVGIDTWYWLEGADDRPITADLDAFGIAVDVRITPGTVRWAFGDGRVTGAGFGRVTHLYASRSTNRGPGAAYALSAGYSLDPTYRIDAGPWIPLAGIPVEAGHPYVVREAQAVIQ